MLSDLKSYLRRIFILTLISSIVFAVEVGSEMELTRLVNARYTASFRTIDKNIKTQLPKGSRGEVMEVKKFASGNSGILLKIKEGNLANELVWVHFNPKSPSLKLFNSDAKPVKSPVAAADATTTRPVPALRDPASPSVAVPAPATNASGDQTRQPTAPPDVADTIPGEVIRINDSLGQLNGRTPPCVECANATAAPGIVGSAQTLQRGIQVTQSADGKMDARVKCDHTGNYGSHSGKFEAIIENNRVTHLDAQIDNGRCRIATPEFKQVEMPNNNIVMKNAAGCTVAFGNHNYTRPGLRDKPVLNFGVVQVQDGPCESLCAKVKEGRGFWQVQADPRTQICN